MRRAVGFVVVVGLIGGAVAVGLTFGTRGRKPAFGIRCGLSLCDNEALIEPEILVQRCSQVDNCRLVPYSRSVFLGFIDLDETKEPRCGPGDCGAVTDALQSGWDVGRWRIVPPRLRRLAHLTRPASVDVTLEAGQTYPIRFVYRDPLHGWPRGPFAHNCLPESAEAHGDFDGDGTLDSATFTFSHGPKLTWGVRLIRSVGRVIATSVDAECPEMIGAVDIDSDGHDELFYDTGRGMTAALVDLLVFRNGRLHNVEHVPRAFLLYVGASNGGIADIHCYRTSDRAGFVMTTTDPVSDETSMTLYELRGHKLLEGIEDAASQPRAKGELNCFNLHWHGY